jgi:hypothetical protein
MEAPGVEYVHKMCVPDEHYAKIKELLHDSGRIGIHLTDKNKKRVRFYKEDGKIMAEERKEDDSIFKQEVIKMSEIQQQQNPATAFQNEMLKRITEDHPDMPVEEREAYADILMQANDSIKRLIVSGVEPGLAYRIIEGVLQNKEIIDNVKPKDDSEDAVNESAEKLAEVLETGLKTLTEEETA